jgi:hypothetical protein
MLGVSERGDRRIFGLIAVEGFKIASLSKKWKEKK